MKRQNAQPTEKDEDMILGMIVNAIVQSFMRHLPRRRHEEMLVAVEASIHDIREHLPRLRLHRPPKSGAAKRRPRKCHYQFGMVLCQLAVRYARLFLVMRAARRSTQCAPTSTSSGKSTAR